MGKKKIDKNHLLPIKTYFYYIVAIIVILLLIWYAYSWYKVIKEDKLKTSYLVSSNTVSLVFETIDEISPALKETPNDYFVLVSYTGNDMTYKLEKKLKKVIDNNDLDDEFYYLDITSNKDDENIKARLNKVFDTKDINDIPCILVYHDGVLVDILENDDKIVNNLEKVIKEMEEKTE